MVESDDFFNKFRRKKFPIKLPSEVSSKKFKSFSWEFDKIFKDMLQEINRDGSKEYVREKSCTEGKRQKEINSFVYGYSITISPEGKPIMREFRKKNSGDKGGRERVFNEKRDYLIDIMEDEEKIRVVLEVPGVDKQEINVKAAKSSLEIFVQSARTYRKILNLPSEIIPETAKATYKNDILEVSLKKERISKPVSKSVQID